MCIRDRRWDRASAQRAIDFFPAVLRHTKGKYAGRPFELLGWEQFVVGSIFGLSLIHIYHYTYAPTKKRTRNNKGPAYTSTTAMTGIV